MRNSISNSERTKYAPEIDNLCTQQIMTKYRNDFCIKFILIFYKVTSL